MLTIIMLKSRTQIRLSLKGFFGLYVFPTLQHSFDLNVNIVTVASINNTLLLWHSRFGHASFHTIKQILRNCNIPFPKSSAKIFCDVCVKSKLHQLPFHQSTTIYSHPLELVYIDIRRPAPISSTNGERYYVAFLDAYSRYSWIYIVHAKSQIASVFATFKTFTETQTNHKLKSIQIDNAKEFLNVDIFLKKHGIRHRLTCPYTHEQNDSIERKHRHIVDTGLALLAHASLL